MHFLLQGPHELTLACKVLTSASNLFRSSTSLLYFSFRSSYADPKHRQSNKIFMSTNHFMNELINTSAMIALSLEISTLICNRRLKQHI